MNTTPEELFVRRYDELLNGLKISDNYDTIKLSGILRQLLIDGTPLIHSANRKHQLKIKFVVNKLSGSSKFPIKPDIHFYSGGINPQNISNKSGTESLSLDRFRKLKVIETKHEKFSISDLIKYLANKKGGIHYDENLDDHEAKISETFDKLGITEFSAFSSIMVSISQVVLTALEPLYNEIVKIPDSIPLIAHYTLNKGQSVHFTSNQTLENDKFNVEILNGLSLGSIIRIRNLPSSGKHIIFDLLGSNSTPSFTTYLNSEGELCASLKFSSTEILVTRTTSFAKAKVFNKYFFLLTELCIGDNDITLRMYINNILIDKDSLETNRKVLNFERKVLGGNEKDQIDVDFSLKEIVISDSCLNEADRHDLSKYFWLKWKH